MGGGEPPAEDRGALQHPPQPPLLIPTPFFLGDTLLEELWGIQPFGKPVFAVKLPGPIGRLCIGCYCDCFQRVLARLYFGAGCTDIPRVCRLLASEKAI